MVLRLIGHLTIDWQNLFDGSEFHFFGSFRRDTFFDYEEKRLSCHIRIVIQNIVMIVVYHHNSLNSQTLFILILKVEELEIFTGHYVLFLFNEMNFSINDLFHPHVFNIAISRFIIASFLNSVLDYSPITCLFNDKIDLLGQHFVRRELASVKRKQIVLLMLNQIFSLKPVSNGSLESVMYCLLSHNHLVLERINLVINKVPSRVSHIGFSETEILISCFLY